MNIGEITELMKVMSETGLTSLKIEEGELKISLKKQEEKEIQVVQAPAMMMQAQPAQAGIPMAQAPMAAPAAGSAAQAEEVIESGNVVTSPLVGTFYSASSPDAPAFAKVGDTVKKGQVLGIIEAMKLMNEIESEFDGVVEAVLVNNEDVVEYGQPLFRIR